MKKLLIFIPLIFLSITIFAAFPVDTHVNDVENLISNNHLSTELPAYGDSPVYGILSLFCGILGILSFIAALVLHSYAYLAIGAVIAALAIIFGVKGLKNKLRGLAMSGLILGIIGVLLGIVCLIVAAVQNGDSHNEEDSWVWDFDGNW